MRRFLWTSLVPAAALALALAAAPLLALDGPAGPKGPLAGYLGCLKVVDLTETQKADVRALLEAAKPKLEALEAALKADRAALVAALGATSPDPCAVGAALLEVEADRKAIGEELKAVRTAVEALLTAEQKAKLEGCLKAPRPHALAEEGETEES